MRKGAYIRQLQMGDRPEEFGTIETVSPDIIKKYGPEGI